MENKWIISALLPLLCLLYSCATPVQPGAKFLPQSEFVFVGTVRQIKTSTINTQDVSKLAVVRVDKILRATHPYQAQEGKLVTIQLLDPQYAKLGQQSIYFTRSWHFGDSLGVIEIGHIDNPTQDTIKQTTMENTRMQTQQAEQELTALLSSAELVVSGRVVTIRKSKIPPGLSEHNPDWHEADIRIEKILKGGFDKDTVTILFPKSNDVIWYKAPKYQPGMEGVWLLKSIDFSGKRLPYPAAINPREFRQMNELENIQKLLIK